MEPIFNEKYYKIDGIKDHFPKPSSSPSHNILCSNCTENQQKIVQLLQSFDTNSSALDHRKQYEMYSNKLESRYPLCATCSYRVSVQLKRCEEEAGLEERRHTALSGGDWQNKLKLAEKMKRNQFKRKVIKGIFFWPDFLFQLFLTVKCVLKDFKTIESGKSYLFYDHLKIWFPSKAFDDFGNFYFVICSLLFFVQFNGISLNRRSPFELVPQLFLLISRLYLGNFLYQKQPEIDLNLILTLAAVGLAVVFKTKSRNALKTNRITFKTQARPEEIIFSKSSPFKENSSQRQERNYQSDKVVGFAAYSENHHRFHSFANQVAPDAAKPIMPWAEKPLPGKLTDARCFNFNENLLSNSNNNSKDYKIRPTKLVSDDPLELEPMFSTFSLSDEPKVIRRSAIRSNPNNSNITNTKDVFMQPFTPPTQSFNQLKESIINSFPKLSIGIVYNSLLTLFLIAFRLTLMQQTSLISIILALTFGLRGFIWPRLSLKVQLVTLTMAVARLAWLGAELNGKIEQGFSYFALTLDLILIILR